MSVSLEMSVNGLIDVYGEQEVLETIARIREKTKAKKFLGVIREFIKYVENDYDLEDGNIWSTAKDIDFDGEDFEAIKWTYDQLKDKYEL